MSFYDVPADRLEMVHQLFEHLSEVTQGSCNFNIIDPQAGNDVLVAVKMNDRYIGEASVDDEGDISLSFGRGQRGLEIRQGILDGNIEFLDIIPTDRMGFRHA
jgi:hypothetical protein